MQKGFWLKSDVAVIGGGSWGTVLAELVSRNCSRVRIWVRSEEVARAVNSTRANTRYFPELHLSEKISAYTDPRKVFGDGVEAVIWALPSKVCRSQAKEMASLFRGNEIVLHATKGVEEGTLKRISVVLGEEIPCRRIGVISGPNLAKEIAQGQPAATVVASDFEEVQEAGQMLLGSDNFRVYGSRDVVGVEWAGTLKNILAISAGALDAMGLGFNSRAMLISRGLAEMVRFGCAMGARSETFLGLSGVGDLLATCSSPLSRNYRVGYGLAKGRSLRDIIKDLGGTAEGVRTTQSVYEFARARNIELPITGAIYRVIKQEMSLDEAVKYLMTRPPTPELD